MSADVLPASFDAALYRARYKDKEYYNTLRELMIHHTVNLESFKNQLLSNYEKIHYFDVIYHILMYT